jgi:hypothetical protein
MIMLLLPCLTSHDGHKTHAEPRVKKGGALVLLQNKAALHSATHLGYTYIPTYLHVHA